MTWIACAHTSRRSDSPAFDSTGFGAAPRMSRTARNGPHVHGSVVCRHASHLGTERRDSGHRSAGDEPLKEAPAVLELRCVGRSFLARPPRDKHPNQSSKRLASPPSRAKPSRRRRRTRSRSDGSANRGIARAALFLASDASRFVTAINLRVDGGMALLHRRYLELKALAMGTALTIHAAEQSASRLQAQRLRRAQQEANVVTCRSGDGRSALQRARCQPGCGPLCSLGGAAARRHRA